MHYTYDFHVYDKAAYETAHISNRLHQEYVYVYTYILNTYRTKF